MTDEEFDALSKGHVDIKIEGVKVRAPDGRTSEILMENRLEEADGVLFLMQDGDTITLTREQARMVAWLMDNDADPEK